MMTRDQYQKVGSTMIYYGSGLAWALSLLPEAANDEREEGA